MKICTKKIVNLSKSLLLSTIIVGTLYSGNYIYERHQFNTGITTNVKHSCFSPNLLTYSYAQESIQDAKKTREERLRKEEEERIRKQQEEELRKQQELEQQRIAEEKAKEEAQKEAQRQAMLKNNVSVPKQYIPVSRGAINTRFELYNANIPMPQDQQSYLYQECQKKGIDYFFALAVIKIESSFNSNDEYQGNYGYFQVNNCHVKNLSQLGYGSDPFNPYTNITWGTYLLGNVISKYKSQGLTGDELYEVVLSAYNKGEGGYNKTGKAYDYIAKHRKALKEIKGLYNS